MAVFPINVRVSQTGARVVSGQLTQVGTAAKGAHSTVAQLQTSLRTLVVGGTLVGLAGLLDSLTTLKNRIQVTVNGTEQAKAVIRELGEISARTGSSLFASGDSYQRVANAIKDLGYNQAQALNFTEQLTKAIQLSGVGSREAAGAAVQLAQGMSANRLGGDELRTVLEQMGYVADRLAEKLGVTRGELKYMGETGAISAKIVYEAIAESAQITEDYAKRVPLISESFEKVRTKVLLAVDSMNEALGVSNKITFALQAVADNLGGIGRVAALAGVVAGGFLLTLTTGFFAANIAAIRFYLGLASGAAAAIAAQKTLVGGFAKFFAVFARNPFTSVITGLLLLQSAFALFNKDTRAIDESFALLKDTGTTVFREIADSVNVLFSLISGKAPSIGLTFSDIYATVEKALGGALLGIIRGIASVIDATSTGYEIIVAFFLDIPKAIGDVFRGALQLVLNLAQGTVNAFIEAANTIRRFAGVQEAAKATFADVAAAAAKGGDAAGVGFTSGYLANLKVSTGATDYLTEFGNKLKGVTEKRQKEELEAIQKAKEAKDALSKEGVDKTNPVDRKVRDKVNDLIRETEAYRNVGDARKNALTIAELESNLKRKINIEEERLLVPIIEVNREFKRRSDIVQELLSPMEKQKLLEADLNALIADKAITTQQANIIAERNLTVVQEAVDELNKEAASYKLTGKARETFLQTYALEQQSRKELGVSLDAVTKARIAEGVAAKFNADLADSLKNPELERLERLRQLPKLLALGSIGQREFTLGIRENREAVQETIDSLNEQSAGYKLVGDARLVLQAIQKQELVDGKALTDVRKAELTAAVLANAEKDRYQQLLVAAQGPQNEYLTKQATLNQMYLDGSINLAQFNEQLAVNEQRFLSSVVSTDFSSGFLNQIRTMQLETRNATAAMGKDFAQIFGPGGTLSKGIGDAVAQAIVFGKSWKESIRAVAQQILSQLISALVQIGVNMLLNATLGQTLQAGIAATGIATGAGLAAAYGPAAALASLASFGANAAAAQAGIAATLATTKALSAASAIPGFEEGGFTGNIGRQSVAGVVHGQEFVVNAEATRRNRAALEALNAGQSINGATNTTAQPTPVSVNIVNEIPDAAFEARALSEGQIEIIARRIVLQESPGAVAADLRNSNSRTSKAFGQSFKAERKR